MRLGWCGKIAGRIRTKLIHIENGSSVLSLIHIFAVLFAVYALPDHKKIFALEPSDVLILVNADSPCSRSIADLYRRYYPEITDLQVLYLSGLADSASPEAGPSDEIITRDEFENLIAQPLRDYLITNNMVDSVYCIITTAGMPYRVEDTDPTLTDVVKPAGSNPTLTVNYRYKVDASSVESDLAVLFQIDPALDNTCRMPIDNRVVNPYQGYKSNFKSWAGRRAILANRQSFRWTYIRWGISKGPKIEGKRDPLGMSAVNRIMSPADIYLVARLDGPRNQGEYPIFSVKDMLNRSRAASSSSVGYNPSISHIIIDHAPGAPDIFSFTQTFNFPPQYDFLDYNSHPFPPGAEEYNGTYNQADHYDQAYRWLTTFDPPESSTEISPIDGGLGGWVLWDDSDQIMNSAMLVPDTGIIGLMTYGRNGGDHRPADYLMSSGPAGAPLFHCVPGAVFTSLESFNALTMFMDVPTNQGKIVEFIEMGGTAAIGHSFEPEVSATIQGDFLMMNLLRDDNGDGVGDLTLAEAAFTALPYISWSEVLIGDPLMRLRLGTGDIMPHGHCPSDTNGDGIVSISDYVTIGDAIFTQIGCEGYDPDADVNHDGIVSIFELAEVKSSYNTICY